VAVEHVSCSEEMTKRVVHSSLPSLTSTVTCKPHSTPLQAPHKEQSGASAFRSCICGARGGCSRFRVEQSTLRASKLCLMAVLNIPSADLLTLGLELVRFSTCRARQNDHTANLRRFAAHFGACPETCSAISLSTYKRYRLPPLASPNHIFSMYLLMTMHWLKTYSTEHQTAGSF
jgi:hypothetical protein